MPIKLMTLAAIAHFTDNGDGSSSVTLFNNREELAADLADNDSNTTVEDIEFGDDPYEHGTLSEVTIDLEYDEETGKTTLANSIIISSDG